MIWSCKVVATHVLKCKTVHNTPSDDNDANSMNKCQDAGCNPSYSHRESAITNNTGPTWIRRRAFRCNAQDVRRLLECVTKEISQRSFNSQKQLQQKKTERVTWTNTRFIKTSLSKYNHQQHHHIIIVTVSIRQISPPSYHIISIINRIITAKQSISKESVIPTNDNAQSHIHANMHQYPHLNRYWIHLKNINW